MHSADKRRCGAKTRSGGLCQSWGSANGRCRMHGAKAGAPKGNRNALKHGLYTAGAISKRRMFRQLRADADDLIDMLE